MQELELSYPITFYDDKEDRNPLSRLHGDNMKVDGVHERPEDIRATELPVFMFDPFPGIYIKSYYFKHFNDAARPSLVSLKRSTCH